MQTVYIGRAQRKEAALQEKEKLSLRLRGYPVAVSGCGEGQPPALLFRPLPLQVKEPPPHLQRIHHTIGQHSHLPGHRLDTLLKLGNVSCGEHIPQRYAACKSKERGDPEACRKPCPLGLPPLLTDPLGTHTSGPYLFHELHPFPQRGLKS